MARVGLGLSVAAAGFAACLAVASLDPGDRAGAPAVLAPEPASDPAVPATWTIRREAPPRFALSAPDLPPAPYVARRSAAGWLDSAEAGRFGAGPLLHVVLTRIDAPAARSGHFVEIASRAAEAGLALARLGRPAALASRFDGLESAEATLATPDGARARRCLSFRTMETALGFSLAGWLCDDAPDAARRLVCRLDRLVLTPEADSDLALQAGFAARNAAADCSDMPGMPATIAVSETAPPRRDATSPPARSASGCRASRRGCPRPSA